LRCEGKIFLDYNPSDNFSWVYELIDNDRSQLIKSTYKDNPFLNPSIVAQIEALNFADPDYYRIYGLGEQANTKETIYTHYTTGEFLTGDTMYTALDPGFTHKSAVVQVSFVSGTCYARELLYVTNNTNNDLITKLHYLPLQDREIIVDAARPDLIEECRRSGLKAKGASKAVQAGILAVKSYPLVVDHNSKNLLKELRTYKWVTDIMDRPTDKPIKENDDAVDALRYAVYEHYLKTNRRTSQSRFDWLSLDI
jgi:phage terminase large subunit